MIRRSTLLLILLTGAISVAVFSVKYRVQTLEGQLHYLNAEIVQDREAVEVLRAEWAHLNDPSRLRRLAEQYLGMAPVAPDHVNPVASIDHVIGLKAPARAFAERETALETTQEMVQ